MKPLVVDHKPRAYSESMVLWLIDHLDKLFAKQNLVQKLIPLFDWEIRK